MHTIPKSLILGFEEINYFFVNFLKNNPSEAALLTIPQKTSGVPVEGNLTTGLAIAYKTGVTGWLRVIFTF